MGILARYLMTPQYAHVSPVLYVQPQHSGPIVIPPNATARHENGLRDHKCDLKLFHTNANIERDLKPQIEDTINAIYLEDIRDPVIKTLQGDIPTILAHLFDNYGNHQPEKVDEAVQNIRDMNFNITSPIFTLYKKIEDLEELSTAVQMGYTTNQLINIALQVLKATNH